MPTRIAIPLPHATDLDYSERAIPQYERAVALAGGEPVRIPLDQSPTEVRKLAESCDAVLLPGSNADVDPFRFQAPRSPHTAAADLRREAVDDLLLEDAFRLRKPILAICYGLQSLNVFRSGSLIQHIPDFLPAETRAKVNHESGKKIPIAHTVEVEPGSTLARIVGGNSRERQGFSHAETAGVSNGAVALVGNGVVIPVNSSHHQSADAIGEGLRIVARCPDDDIIEALEGTAPGHFVLAVQWHPERSVEEDERSRAIFRALVEAAKGKTG